MAATRPQKPITFAEVDRLLKKQLGAVYVDHFDREYAEWRISEERQAAISKSQEEVDMGIFSKLQEKGLDLSQVDADPFNYPDGRYNAMLVEVDYKEPKQAGWAEQLEIVWEFTPGQPVADNEKHVGKSKRDYLSIPTPEMFEKAQHDEEMAKRVEKMIQKTVQFLTQLGLSEEEIDGLTPDEIHRKLQGKKYQFEIATGMANEDGKRPPKWTNNIRPLEGVTASAASLLGDDDEDDD